jgi:hypothetical protein
MENATKAIVSGCVFESTEDDLTIGPARECDPSDVIVLRLVYEFGSLAEYWTIYHPFFHGQPLQPSGGWEDRLSDGFKNRPEWPAVQKIGGLLADRMGMLPVRTLAKIAALLEEANVYAGYILEEGERS